MRRSRREKVGIVARAAAVGAVQAEFLYLRRLAVFFATWPMGLFIFLPPDGIDYRPDVGDWICRIIFGALVIAVNLGILLPELSKRFVPMTRMLFGWATVTIIVATPLAYVMRLLVIDRH
ncbi:hypothetical protein GCM10023195_88160 [Actinoallomurus liliacearum]|uniref:Uncharacterized protein n=1 Tax=Actinoallomurus liliacearum TaxID=1080073 RepID=A0ABP8U0J5_9ACTN